MTLLGTGGSAGVPQLGGADGTGDWGACDPADSRNRRTRSSIVIESGAGESGAGESGAGECGAGQRLLVDTSPDMRAQLLACGVPRVDAILFTHAHADHVLGLDDVRILNRIVKRPLDVFAEGKTMGELQKRFDYAFKAWEGPHFFRPVLVPHVVSFGETIETCGMTVRSFEQDHGFLSTMGLRVDGFAYSTDVATLDEAALEAVAGVDTWVVDCFQRQRHTTHANVEQVIAWYDRVRPRRMVLTHMGFDIDFGWLVRRLPAGIEPGFDGMVLEVG